MFIQWALSALPDLTPSHNGNVADGEVRSQALRSICVQPAAASAASHGGTLKSTAGTVCAGTCKCPPDDKAVAISPVKRKHRILNTTVSQVTFLFSFHFALFVRALIVREIPSERMPSPSSPTIPPTASQRKDQGILRLHEVMKDTCNKMALRDCWSNCCFF